MCSASHADTSLVGFSAKCTEAEIGYLCKISSAIGECHALNEYLRIERNARRVRKRTYFKVLSGMNKYKRCRQRLRWVTLTVHPDDQADFQRSWRKLIMRLRRRGMIKEYIRVPEQTKKGVRHEHILFLGSYIEQRYLSYLWKRVTSNSYVTWISKVVSKTAQYLAKYASKCPQWRVCNSRGWVVRKLCSEWSDFKRVARECNLYDSELYRLWSEATARRLQRLWEWILDKRQAVRNLVALAESRCLNG